MNTTSRSTYRRALLAAVGMVAVVGVASVAYGAAIEPAPSTTSRTTPAATTTGLSEQEADGIVFMVEEEKLARDVYLTLGDLWGLPIFSNIASAERTHMDAVLGLVDTYGLDDPSDGNDIGVFADPELQALYDDLVAAGSESTTAALEVGATIEEVDIEDLVTYLDETTLPDVTTVYERLLSGSENHLRAFVSQLEANGIDRSPVVLDGDTYDSILEASSGPGGNRAGQAAGPGRGHGRNG